MSWQQTRNYRKVVTENNEIKYYIYVDGHCVEVNQAVYLCYSQENRKERYELEKRNNYPHVSLEYLQESGVPEETYIRDSTESPEDILIVRETAKEFQSMVEKVPSLISTLSKDEQILIRAIFYDGISEREYSKLTGIPRATLQYRQKRIFKTLKKLLDL